ncbi:glucosamine-6-phosphate deaminase [Georgenia sp. 311]|uniref:Glucosamine-6-phosphate deaminase n=1 Tax=Georgenia wutianyii TaxID=2585135 RepID=A0ABX5VIZ3_9MICO|nr:MULTISPECIES: 6-phosphogluconolactonase [Georgenia]QDB78346.1 glucosamine-6-phosphate deaminase [Georgenia wutianyii]TNC18493.1 glucosamine-6-phosphate deaminase [Georgenia sp. 311]
MLELIRNRTHDELGAAGARLAVAAISRAHAEGRAATVLLAAAPSQIPVLRALAAADIHDKPVRYFHMDEYVGLPEDAPQAFGAWLGRTYFDQLPAGHQATFERIDAGGDPESAAAAYAALLPAGDFDLVLCGIGINGHLAFNDPGCDLQDPLPVRHIRLARASRVQQVDEGLFPALGAVPEHAVTVTVPRMLASRAIVCSVLGEAKAEAVRAMLEEPVGNAVPATALREHPVTTVLVDEEAMSRVG